MGTLVDVAKAAGTLKRFMRAAKTAGLIDNLEHKGPFTVFAPTDKAFARIDEATLDALFDDPERMRTVLENHIVAAKLSSRDMGSRRESKTLGGEPLQITPHGGTAGIEVSEAHLVIADLEADNGIIHAIDEVLLPHSKGP